MVNTIKLHLMDCPILLKSFGFLRDKKIIGTGSKYGRFIFNQDTAAVVIEDSNDVLVESCYAENFDVGVRIKNSNNCDVISNYFKSIKVGVKATGKHIKIRGNSHE